MKHIQERDMMMCRLDVSQLKNVFRSRISQDSPPRAIEAIYVNHKTFGPSAV
jgi:hypothetical protein